MMINVNTLRSWLEQDKAVTVLDVRPAAERAEWAIPGSVHVDAYEALKLGVPDALKDLNLPRSVPIVAVCAAGKTSLIAAEQLRKRGFDAVSLKGGMRAWSLAWNSAEVTLSKTKVIQVRRTGKGCLSYLIGSEDEAAVIDAALDPEVYGELAQARDWRITKVMETHIHADHLSRARTLAEITGAELILPAQDRVSFPFTAVREGEVQKVGKATLQALHTPGHTAESTCYLLDEEALFTGDTLFLDGVGRPDLEADADGAQVRAQALYKSLKRLRLLPEETLILPGHSGKPVAFDGKPLAATLAEVRQHLKILTLTEPTFVRAILARIPPTPPNHERIIKRNEAGNLPDDPTELEAGANRCAVT